jgi:hypothetical protein
MSLVIYRKHGCSVFGFFGLIRGEVGIVYVDYEASCWLLFGIHLPCPLFFSFHFYFFDKAFISLKKDNGLKFLFAQSCVVKDTKKFVFSFFGMVFFPYHIPILIFLLNM